MERDDIAGVSVGCQQIREFDLTVKRIHIVTILVDFVVPNPSHGVADLESGFRCRRAWFHIRYVNAASFAFFTGELTQLRIARGEE